MSYFLAGSAVLATTGSIIGGMANKSSAIKGINAQSKAEGEATVRERLNKTISNSYATALGGMQLALRKRQLSEQSGGITAAGLVAGANNDVQNAATGSIGGTVQAVQSDINMKIQTAKDQTKDAFEQDVENYNASLDMMVLNTDQSAPAIRQPEYTGPSTAAIIGMSAFQGVSQFTSSYAMKKMAL